MGPHITRIGKHHFVCGLSCRSLPLSLGSWRELTKLADKMEANLVALCKGGTAIQAGYTQIKKRLPRGLYSLAAVISLKLLRKEQWRERQAGHNWLCALKLLDGKWAYCAVRNGNFLPQRDFAGSRRLRGGRCRSETGRKSVRFDLALEDCSRSFSRRNGVEAGLFSIHCNRYLSAAQTPGKQVLAQIRRDDNQSDRNIVIEDAALEDCGFISYSIVRGEDLLPHSKGLQIGLRKQCTLLSLRSGIAWPSLPSALTGSGILAPVNIRDYARLTDYLRKHQDKDATIAHCKHDMTRYMQTRSARMTLLRKSRSWYFGYSPRTSMRACTGNKSIWPAWRDGGSATELILRQEAYTSYDATTGKPIQTANQEKRTKSNDRFSDADTLLRSLTSRFQLLALSIDMVSPAAAMLPVPPQHELSGTKQTEMLWPGWKTFSLTLNTGGLALADIAELLSYPAIRIDKSVYRAGTWSIEGLVYA